MTLIVDTQMTQSLKSLWIKDFLFFKNVVLCKPLYIRFLLAYVLWVIQTTHKISTISSIYSCLYLKKDYGDN